MIDLHAFEETLDSPATTGRHLRTRARLMDAAVERLRMTDLFAVCSHDDVEAMIRAGSSTVIPNHWAFMQQSTPADAAYLLLDGSARVFRHGIPVASVGRGDVVGEAALLHGTLRNATVSSTSTLKALRIERDRFARLMDRRPRLREVLAGLSAQRAALSSGVPVS